MSLKKAIQQVLIIFCMITLASCSTSRWKNQQNHAQKNTGQEYSDGAEASGIGQSARFGERSLDGSSANTRNSRHRAVAKRVYYFDFDSYRVRRGDKKAVEANADYLAANPRAKVMIEGNTDPRGSREYNIGLGERRAKAVAEMLAADGVNPAQMRLVSYGAEKRASYGNSEADYQKDRRVVLVYTKG